MAAPMETLVAKQECSFSRSFDAVKCEGDCQIIYKLRCDISDHLIRFKSGPKDKHVSIPEGLLILYRAGLFTVENATMKMTICDSHRDKLSTQWYRCKRTCAHPLHPKTSKEKPDRGITLAIAKEIWVHDRTITAVGDGLCRSCVERHKKTYLTVVDVQNDIVEFHKVAMNFHEQNINRSEQMVPCSPCFSPATYPSEDYVDEMNPDAADINSSLQIYSSGKFDK
ncbi:uncharacterized protein LOC127702950 [Mytilus californianus]|uniref:uncharacterized protein LOC127702950 n=1 Tax=Mytilus californianus TaxID=6549 RepID=UPI002245D630|nr:uncharacterized protein LOC127702950 [Mytilus californianus]